MKPWAKQFYAGVAWLDCRESFLQSKGYLCERCKTNGDINIATIAHHRTYLTRENINDPNTTLAWDNLEALCQDCHNREHHVTVRSPRYKFDDGGVLLPLPPGGVIIHGGFRTEPGV